MEQQMTESSLGAPSFVPSVMRQKFELGLDFPGDMEATVGSLPPPSRLDKDFLCPICMDPMNDAFLTACGHSFCYCCIKTHLNHKQNCPCCSQFLTHEQIYPNFTLNKLLRKATSSQLTAHDTPSRNLRSALQQGVEMSVKEIDLLLAMLVEKKRKAEQEDAEVNMEILLDFLHRSRLQKQRELDELRADLKLIKTDIFSVQQQRVFFQTRREQAASIVQQLLLQQAKHVNGSSRNGGGGRAGGMLSAAGSEKLQGGASRSRKESHQQLLMRFAGERAAGSAPPHRAQLGTEADAQLQEEQQRNGNLRLPATSSDMEEQKLRTGSPSLDRIKGYGLPDFGPALTDGRGGMDAAAATSPPFFPSRSHSMASGENRAGGGDGAQRQGDSDPHAQLHRRGDGRSGGGLGHQPMEEEEERGGDAEGAAAAMVAPDLGNFVGTVRDSALEAAMAAKKRRVFAFFDDLQECYLQKRRRSSCLQEQGAFAQAVRSHSSSQRGVPIEVSGSVDKGGSRAAAARCAAGADAHQCSSDAAAVALEGELARDSARHSLHLDGSVQLKQKQHHVVVGGGMRGGGGEGRAEGLPYGLEEFQEVLTSFTKYSRLRVVAELRHGDLFHSSNIVSSIEFDRDDELFATAGVSRRIKVFEFATVVGETADVHCPVVEMPTRSKLSCLSWNKYIKGHIASSDYEGIVTVWDVNTCQSIMEYEEHEKRAWSVDFSRTEPTQLVSGSDDGKVKLWCTRQESSVLNIDMKANICCVKFNPSTAHHIAVGSADHHIHYFDLRNPSLPLHVFSGHRKAVSYVKFISPTELASASTDSTLRLWDVGNNSPIRTMRGHTNEKNFVGLTVNSEFVACGSETNEVYVYFKAMSRPATVHRFGNPDPITGEESDDDTAHFISAVCWKSESPVMLAANSQGTIKVLALAP